MFKAMFYFEVSLLLARGWTRGPLQDPFQPRLFCDFMYQTTFQRHKTTKVKVGDVLPEPHPYCALNLTVTSTEFNFLLAQRKQQCWETSVVSTRSQVSINRWCQPSSLLFQDISAQSQNAWTRATFLSCLRCAGESGRHWEIGSVPTLTHLWIKTKLWVPVRPSGNL